AERFVIIATTPGTRSLPVTTFCKISSHALFKLLPIDIPPVASLIPRFAPNDVGRCNVLKLGSSLIVSTPVARTKIHRGRNSNSDRSLENELAPGLHHISTERLEA